MTIAVTGWRTTIWQELHRMIRRGEKRIRIEGRVGDDHYMSNVTGQFPTCNRYLFAQGWIAGQPIDENFRPEHTFNVNLISVMQRTRAAFFRNPKARIVVIGSLSAVWGSHDPWYATSKAGLHAFVRTWRGLPDTGQLNCVAPTIIRDSGMTVKRPDFDEVIATRPTVTAKQVAELCYYLLYHDHGLNRAVIEMPGAVVKQGR